MKYPMIPTDLPLSVIVSLLAVLAAFMCTFAYIVARISVPRRARPKGRCGGSVCTERRGSIARAMRLATCLMGALALSLPQMAQADNAWTRTESSEDATYRELMAEGDRLAQRAAEPRGLRVMQRRKHWKSAVDLALQAVDVYEQASLLRPKAAEPHYRAAEVLNLHFLKDPPDPVYRDRGPAERALSHWRAFAQLSPLDPRVTDSLFEQALVYTRLASQADLERAIAAYEALLARSDLSSAYGSTVATWLSNLAETYMMVGRLGDAIACYRRALAYGNEPLHGYGLAVALDRDEQGALAREVMLSHALTDRLRELSQDGVFFVPEGEKEYYLALGWESLGDLRRALSHYRKFVESGAHPRYQKRAVDHIRRIEAKLRGGYSSGIRVGEQGRVSRRVP